MKIGLIGCGYVAQMYAKNAILHPEIPIVRAFDTDHERARSLGEAYGIAPTQHLDDILTDPSIELI